MKFDEDVYVGVLDEVALPLFRPRNVLMALERCTKMMVACTSDTSLKARHTVLESSSSLTDHTITENSETTKQTQKVPHSNQNPSPIQAASRIMPITAWVNK